MTRTRIDPPAFAWLACPDCPSQLFDHRFPGLWTIEVEHAPTCPAWPEPGRPEIALQLKRQEHDHA